MSVASAEQRVFVVSVACVAAHQVQSFVEEPEERRFRVLVLMALAATTVLFFQSPHDPATRTRRGIAALLMGVGPTFGAIAGHAVPLLRRGTIVPASETAILNLGGGVFLLLLGAALLGRKAT